MAKHLTEDEVVERLMDARDVLGEERCRVRAFDTAISGARKVLEGFVQALLKRQEDIARASDPPAPAPPQPPD